MKKKEEGGGILARWFGKRPARRTVRLERSTSIDGQPPSSWLRYGNRKQGELGRRDPAALVKCPAGHRFALVPGSHAIDDLGVVGAPVRCPECPWTADRLELDAWGEDR